MASGRTPFRWHAGGQFFSGFENSEILDADLTVSVLVDKSGRYVGVDIDIEGTVVVACDRCLGELTLPVSVHPSFSVKFGDASEDKSSAADGDREIIFLPESDTDMDLSQVVYDYVCTSLPMLRVHPDGECDPATVKYLHSEDDSDVEQAAVSADSPFAALKDLLGEK
ncbi:MAG: DUF177 domain-containing protein [Bacteroidales bacterium]|nr:DUF177 domain-containing protein [Bacteroidales bacterium]